MEEIDEMIEERELKAGTQILEMVILPVKSPFTFYELLTGISHQAMI